MNLISGIHHSCERREYTFIVLQEYTIISHKIVVDISFLIFYKIFTKNIITVIFLQREMLTNVLRALVKNLVKESFYGKEKKINIFTVFFISH